MKIEMHLADVDLNGGRRVRLTEIDMPAFVPLSVREDRRAKFRWWFKGRREVVALWLAPWLGTR